MKSRAIIFLLSLILLIVPIGAEAHGGHHGGGGDGPGSGGGGGGGNGPGSGGGYGDGAYNDTRYFDPTSIYTYSGTLSDTNGFFQQQGNNNCTGGGMSYLFTNNTGESFYLMTGPWWFLDENGIDLYDGLNLTVTGSVIPPHNENYQDYNYIIVTELKVGNTTLQLRDADGFPLWQSSNYGGMYYNCPAYDTNTFGDYSGEVIRVRSRTNGPNSDIGYELIIRTLRGNQRYRVFVGPQYHIEDIGFSCSNGDIVRLFGSRKGGAVVTQRIKVRGEKLHKLRSMQGDPLWVQ